MKNIVILLLFIGMGVAIFKLDTQNHELEVRDNMIEAYDREAEGYQTSIKKYQELLRVRD